jgi:catechol 2,3-dioxygenase-like lactoylglutathione lyase family enzyme
MSQAILGLDHAVIAVNDLDAACTVYNRLGFTNVPMGNHMNRATANYCIMFPDTYLELLGMNEPHLEDFGFKAFLAERGEGFQRLANGTSDADTIAAHLTGNGLEIMGPMLLERPQAYPEGMVTFHNVMIPPAQTDGIWTFFCCHKTPELMRTPEWMEHANGAVAMATATSVVEDLSVARAALTKVYGAGALVDTPYGFATDLPRGQVKVTTRENFAQVHPGAEAPAGGLPAWSGLRLTVKDVAETAAYLATQGIATEKLADGSLRVAKADACGVLMEFAAG